MPKFKKDWSSVLQKMKEQSSGGNYSDARIYKPEFKEDGTAGAIIRFLEAPDVDVPMVPLYHHYFKSVGGWYVDNCPTTIGGQCPVCEDNTKHWNEGKEGEEFVRTRRSSRILSYYSNILVIKDEKNPKNVGKVWLFKFGKKIYEKIDGAIKQDMIPWDELAGVNFNLVVTKKKVGENFLPNYDGSHFFKTEDGEAMETPLEKYGNVDELNKSLYPLKDFIDVSQFKAYDSLTEKLNRVLGETSGRGNAIATEESQPQPSVSEKPTVHQTIEDTVKKDSTEDVKIEDDKVFSDDADADFFDDMSVE